MTHERALHTYADAEEASLVVWCGSERVVRLGEFVVAWCGGEKVVRLGELW